MFTSTPIFFQKLYQCTKYEYVKTPFHHTVIRLPPPSPPVPYSWWTYVLILFQEAIYITQVCLAIYSLFGRNAINFTIYEGWHRLRMGYETKRTFLVAQ